MIPTSPPAIQSAQQPSDKSGVSALTSEGLGLNWLNHLRRISHPVTCPLGVTEATFQAPGHQLVPSGAHLVGQG